MRFSIDALSARKLPTCTTTRSLDFSRFQRGYCCGGRNSSKHGLWPQNDERCDMLIIVIRRPGQ